ncbi:outer membrane protein [Rhizobium ruizarguesonis]
MKNIYCTAAALFMMATIAGAADLIEEPPPAKDWNGPYIGLHLGYGWEKATFDDCECGVFNDRRVGSFAGYNWAISDGYVVGIEGDVNYDWNRQPVGYPTHVGTGLSGSARVRAGYQVGNVLVFAAGGWTAANAYVEHPNDRKVANGWTVGVGADWAATESTLVRMEYRYNNFSPVDLDGGKADFGQDVINIGIANPF